MQLSKSKIINYVNYKAQTSNFTQDVTGQNSITIIIPSGVYNLSKSILSWKSACVQTAANQYLSWLFYTDLVGSINSIRVSMQGSQLMYIPEFQKVNKLLGITYLDRNKQYVASQYFKKKQQQQKSLQVLTAATVAVASSTQDTGNQVTNYGRVNATATNAVAAFVESDCLLQQYNSFKTEVLGGAAATLATVPIHQISLAELCPRSIFEIDEPFYIPTSMEIQLQFDNSVAASVLRDMRNTATYLNHGGAVVSIAQVGTINVSDLQIVAAKYQYLSAVDCPDNYLFGYNHVNQAVKKNENLSFANGVIGQKMNFQILSFFNSGADAVVDNKYNNANVKYDGTNTRITTLDLMIDNQNIIQSASSTGAEYLAQWQMNKPKNLNYDYDALQYYQHFWVFDYSESGEGQYDGKDAMQERSFSFNVTVHDNAETQYVLITNMTRILQIDKQSGAVRII